MPIKTLTVHSFKWTNGRGHNQKPLLYSVKNDTNGLGHSVHSVHSDQWWENAFDKQLKGLKVDDSKNGQVSLQATAVSLKEQIKFGAGRWMTFIPGGILGGSMGEHDALVAQKLAANDTTKDSKETEKMKRREERAKRKLEKLQMSDKSAARRKRREERAERREKRIKKKEKKERKRRKELEKGKQKSKK